MNHKLIESLHNTHPKLTIVMASKYLEPQDFDAFIHGGITNFGENRDHALMTKKEALKDCDITWHFIGTLQTKKVKKIINDIDILHTLDRLKFAEAIEKYRNTVLPCFIQVNISLESQKHGILESELTSFLNALKPFKKIHVIGLMGMAEETNNKARIDAQFAKLSRLKSTVQKQYPHITELSMGMSQDYELALKHGATHLRLGRILLEDNHG